LAPDLDLVMLMRNPTHWYRSRPFVDVDWLAGPGIDMVREHPDLIARIIEGGTRVHCWTVNTPADIDLCSDLGIEAIITDTPGAAVAHMRSSDA
jgi:glycerophosphoryl diester phosphodiesterase